MTSRHNALLASLAVGLFIASVPAAFAESLQGLNGHKATGSATLDAGKVELGSDFWFDGGPDVYVAIQKDGKIQVLGELRANSGAQTYELPSGLSGADADNILLWCKQYNVTLGKAALN